ncbi:DEAD/DEAH box helicase [Salsuginibacillus kocurii]|uniref:DEAD/DEAH box helicase n=1 Tax=Salsuginibacillus kocurii TaxID=427078 RepID=UPI00036082BD|nr:DEAD/DEAH box helicase [Salsuginibacillus kocurii]
MFPLTRQAIRNLVPERIFQRGTGIVEMGQVMDITVMDEGNHFVVQADVMGSTMYEVDMDVYANGELGDRYCSCPAARDMPVCKHMIAGLLKATTKKPKKNDVPTTSASKGDSSWRKSWEHELKRIDERLTHKLTTQIVDAWTEAPVEEEAFEGESELNLQFNLKFSPDRTLPKAACALRIKAGTERLYFVKDVKGFLDAVANREPFMLTTRFTFDPAQHVVSEDTARQLAFFKRLQDHNEQFEYNRMYGLTTPQEQIDVVPPFVDETFAVLKEAEQVYVEDSSELVPLSFHEESYPDPFILFESDNTLWLSQLHPELEVETIPGSDLLHTDAAVYQLNDELNQAARPLLDAISASYSKRLPLDRNQLEVLAGTIFPVLDRYHLLLTDGSLEGKLVTDPCEPVLHLAREEDTLLAALHFTYGQTSIDPFSEERSEGVYIARDVKAEQRVMGLMEQAAFRFNGTRLALSGGENLGRFFGRILPKLEELCQVTMTTEAQDMYIEDVPDFTVDFAIDESGGWFDVQFRTDDISPDDLDDVLKALETKQSYHRTKNGRFLSLEGETMQKIRDVMEGSGVSADELMDGRALLPKYRALEADNADAAANMVQRSALYDELIRAIKQPETVDADAPEKLQADLRDYQLRGFRWFTSLARYGFGGVLADDMGLGKTLQALTYILHAREADPEAQPFLVVAPSSLVYNWEKEARTFTPALNVQVIDGPKHVRREALEASRETVDLYITSYPLLRRDVDLYEGYVFQGVFLDEAQTFKNNTSLTFKAIRSLRAAQAFALSGTPVENRVEELWSLFAVIMPGIFPERKQFKQLPMEKIQRKAAPFILRRTKGEVLTELPEKIEHERYTELTKEQRKLYLAYLEQVQQDTAAKMETEGFQKSRMHILSNLTRLRQLCCHPGLFIEDYQGDSGKLEELKETVDTALENGSRLLVFSQFTGMLDLISQAFDEREIDYFYLDGSTPGAERVERTTRFNAGERDVFLISLKAGGTGLNLTGADTVVLFDLWWNPAVEAQAADRAHRIGQKNVVNVMKLITKGTIEEKIQSLQYKKKDMFDKLIQSGETDVGAMSEEDIREILNI